MTARLPFLLAACFVLTGSAVGQEYMPPDPQYPRPLAGNERLASLVPAHTLAYLELQRPDRLAEEIRQLIKGSQLEEPGQVVCRLRRSKGDTTAIALPCNLFAPEVLNELGGYEGGLVALTGLTREGTPQVVAVLKTGKGGMASLAMRCYLASSDEVYPVGRVKGVNIYGVEKLKVRPLHNRQVKAKPLDADSLPAGEEDGPKFASPPTKRQKKREGGVFLAQIPEAIVAGSTQAAVEDVLRRLRGESKTPSLADSKAFQEATALRTAPGLFAYADASRLYRLARMMRMPRDNDIFPPRIARQLDSAQEDEERKMGQRLKQLEEVLNPRGVRFVAGGWSLDKGEYRSFLEVRTQEGQIIPALDWLASEKLSDDLLQAVPADAFYVLAVPVCDGLRRLDVRETRDTLVTILSLEDVPDLEKKLKGTLKVSLIKEVLGRVRSLAVAGGWHLKSEGEFEARPVVLVEAVNEEAAGELEKLWPRLYPWGEKAALSRQVRVREQAIHCLRPWEGETVFGALPPCYARCGRVLVLGWSPKSVAAAVRAPREGRPLLNLPRALAAAQQEKAGVVFLFSCRQMLRQLSSLIEQVNTSEQAAVPHLRRMSRAMEAMPPTVLVVKHEGSRYRCEMRQGELQKAATPVLNALVPLMKEGVGVQTWVGGMTLPDPKYLEHPPLYVPPSARESESPKSLPAEEISEPPVPEPPARESASNGKLPAVQLINTAKVKFSVRLKMGSRPEEMPVDVYISSDDGATWQLLEGNHQLTPLPEEVQATITEGRGSVTVKIPREGVVYGFCIRKKGHAGPAPGRSPDMRVERDETVPDARLWGPELKEEGRKAVLRWEAEDRNLANEPIALEWAEKAEGPWHVIAANLPNTGKYSWSLAQVPIAVFLRLSARDRAGNVGVATTTRPVLLEVTPPEKRVIGGRP